MTNTLHRYGDAEGLKDDYIVFAMPTRGINDEGAPEKLRAFLRLALKYDPVNIGDARKGGVFHPDKGANPLYHWRRGTHLNPDEVINGIDGCTVASAVFDNPQALTNFLRDVKAADFGISVNVSALTDAAHQCALQAGIVRHSVEYSLGFRGKLDKLPDRRVLELSTMCGHGMVSSNFAKKMVDWVKENRRQPEEAARYMAKFCVCGIYNVTRATRILEEARVGR